MPIDLFRDRDSREPPIVPGVCQISVGNQPHVGGGPSISATISGGGGGGVDPDATDIFDDTFDDTFG